jgi:transposase
MNAAKTGRKTQWAPKQLPTPQTDTPPKPRYVGVDLHKQAATFHIVDASGMTIEQGRFDVTPAAIHVFATEKLRSADSLAVEVTSNTWAFVRLVREHVSRVVVSNPMKTKAIAEANVKTDKVDARVLAQLLRCDYLPGVWMPTQAIEDSRALAARRTALVGQRTAIRNRIHSVLARRMIPLPKEGVFSAKGLVWLKTLAISPLDRDLIDADLKLLDAIDEHSQMIDRLLIAESYHDPDVQLLMTLPGLDYTVAHALKAALANIERFPDPDKAAAYLGLVPSVRQSANKCYNGPITKAGSSQVRWLLVQAAQSIGCNPGPLGAFFRKLEKRKNRNVAVVATARKLVTIAWHMLKNNEPYRYAVPRSTETKLASLRVRATGVKRKTGNPEGTPRQSKLGAGKTRTIPSLDEVYARQGVPSRRPLAEGEMRMIRERETEVFVADLGRTHIVPRKSKSPRKRG